MSEYDEVKKHLVSLGTSHPHFQTVAHDAIVAIEALVKERDVWTRERRTLVNAAIAATERAEASDAEVERLKEALDRAGNPQLPAPASAYVEMRDECDRLKGLLVPIIKEYDEACFDNFITWPLGEAVEAARSALEAKP